MAAWNALFIISGLLLIALMGEAYFRLTKPPDPPVDTYSVFPSRFVDGVGHVHEPNAELRYWNQDEDTSSVSRANSLGFLDREPVSAKRAAAGCHIAFIGDSFVEAREVSIADKFHVRLEEVAARELPHLSITTQAYGMASTGQINQLPFYDEYARRLSPKLVVLVFYINDFTDNSLAPQALTYGADPERMPYMTAQRDATGSVALRPPDPQYRRFLLPMPPKRWYESASERLSEVSYFGAWLLNTKNVLRANSSKRFVAWAKMIAERPCCASQLDGWQLGNGYRLALDAPFRKEHLPPYAEEALEYTAFGIDQFKRRADRDGSALAILSATEDMGTRGDPQFDRLSAIAEPRGIPVISGYEYILRQGYDAEDGRWRFDPHWNSTGHQWAAEAVLEWLKQNQDVCD